MKSALNSDSQRFSSPLGSTSFLFLFTTVFLSLNRVHSTFSQAWHWRSKEGLFTPWCKISKKLWNPCRCLAGRRLASVRVTIFDDRLPSLLLQPSRHQIAAAEQPTSQFLPKGSPFSTTLCSNGSVYNLVPQESWNRDPLLDFSGGQLFGTLRYVLC